MPVWLGGLLVGLALLALIKILYVVCTAMVIRVTRGALFVSTSRNTLQAALNAVNMSREGLFVDLGCGNGGVLKAFNDRYDVRTLGYEINPMALVWAKIRLLGRRNASAKWGDFWKVDLKDADVVFCYLFPDVLPRLVEKLQRELKPGSRVISCNFPLPGWVPSERIAHGESAISDPVYVYQIPDAFDGTLVESSTCW